MGRLKNRADRIREEVEVTELLSRLGYQVHSASGDEQQFKCDLHGGHDAKPSARVYPQTNSWFCWACGKARDPVETIKDNMHVDAREACKIIEGWYSLPTLPWEDEVEPEAPKDTVEAVLTASVGWDKAAKRCAVLLQNLTEERVFNLGTTFKLWALFDRVAYGVAQGTMTEDKAGAAVDKLRVKVLALWRRPYAARPWPPTSPP